MFELLAGSLRGGVPDRLAGALDADLRDTRRAMEVSLPALIGGMRDKTQTPGGASDLLEMLQTEAGQPVADIEGFLGAGDARAGAGILDRVFAERGEIALTSLGKASGLSTRLLAQVMSMLAPIASGWLGDKARTEGFGEAELTAFLGTEATSLEDAGYGKVLALLGAAGAGAAGVAGVAAGAATAPPVATAPETVAAAAPGASYDSAPAPAAVVTDDEYGYVDNDDFDDPATVIPGAPRGDEVVDPYEQSNRSGWLWWIVAAVALIALLGLVLNECRGDGTEETTVDSVEPQTEVAAPEESIDIQAELNNVLLNFPGVSGVRNGDQAILTGRVADDAVRAQAESAALSVAGINAVNNQIEVGSNNGLKNLINANPDLSTFSALLTEAGLSDALAGNGPFTVFAPANSAFAGMSADELSALRANPEQLAQLIQYHVVSGLKTSGDLAVTESLTTVQGEPIKVSFDGTIRLDDQVQIDQTDIQADNGVYHVVSGVLRPTALRTAVAEPEPQELSAALSLNPITFELGSSVITDEGKVEIDKVVTYLISNPQNLEVAGHTDADGDAEFNKTLSQERADAVEAYLVEKGVPADSLNAVGYGEDNPIAGNETQEDKAKNRRIEFTTGS